MKVATILQEETEKLNTLTLKGLGQKEEAVDWTVWCEGNDVQRILSVVEREIGYGCFEVSCSV